MKKLSKLHLRSEQYLTDSEMKLISGGADDPVVYYDCPYKSTYSHSNVCYFGTKCIIKNYIQGGPGGAYTLKEGICTQRATPEDMFACTCE